VRGSCARQTARRASSCSSAYQTFVHRYDGKRYAYDGISCMFCRYAKKCGLKDFRLYDLKGKAATDMYRAGVPLEQIQHLLLRRSAL
jgi:hypothetical protein